MSREPVAPTPQVARIQALDALRGVAILGVLLAYTVWSLGNPPVRLWSRADTVTAVLMDLLVDTKFVTIFACLFGVGVAQQWRRWAASGASVVPFHVRRMGFLLVAGLLHAVFLRNGDILAPYALMGLSLLLVRGRSSRVLLTLILVLLMVTPLAEMFRAAMGWRWPARPDTERMTSFIAENLTWDRYWYVINPVRSWPGILALMLIGLAIERVGFVARLASDRRLAFSVLATALPLAAVARLAMSLRPAHEPSPSSPAGLMFSVLSQVSAWPLSAAYAGAVFLCWQFPKGMRLLRPLTFVGRMAFTNYLLQSMIAVPICLAFGWFDKVSPTDGVLLALAIALVQILFSGWWLRHDAMGPFERIWRRVTYGATAPRSGP
jgi:uncharacterized protein